MISRPTGMTLIELLVVLAIVATLATLIAPAGFRQVERASAQAEWATLVREMENASSQAFFTGAAVRMEFDGAILRAVSSSGQSRDLTFQHVFFLESQVIWLNANGVADPAVVYGWMAGRRRELKLNGWLREQP